VFEDGGPEVLFRDVRKFGKVRLLAPGAGDPRLDKLGPDALGVSAEHLLEAARRRNGPVKAFLLDQGVLAGVGNIYADEALFLAGIRPAARSVAGAARGVGAPGRGESARCSNAASRPAARSISDYVHPDGSDGGYQDERRVYGREGEACSTCGAVILRVVIATRSSSYCPRCQR
jgi:formamidopyrimidine-DNA glycosylase